MKQIVGQLAALMLNTELVTSVAATPAFADWDKTKYPAIQGTIPIEDGQDFKQLSNISLVDAMSTADGHRNGGPSPAAPAARCC